jgi:predicted alpha/beta-fold hydrolase
MTNAAKTRFGQITTSSFNAPIWAANAHLQTIFPKFFIRAPQIAFKSKRIDTPDGDFLDLAINLPHGAKTMAVLFHGLEGSKDSHYILHLVEALQAQGIASLVMHFRGCSGEINQTPRAYHSGEIGDALHTLQWIGDTFSDLRLFTIGFSLGGNMLLKLISEHSELPIEGAVSVSAPLDLAASSQAINQGFARKYQAHLLKSMKATLSTKMQRLDMRPHLSLSIDEVEQLDSFYAFDEHVTSKLHGFVDAKDYYQRASALPDLHKITVPTLILHAADDPFMDARVIPTPEQISPSVAYELSKRGGHVGFLYGNIWQPKFWLPTRIIAFIQEHL